jgi:hypothetical protein
MKNEVRKLINKYLVERDMERGLKQLSEETGIKYLRLQEHIKHPEQFRLFELQAIDDVLNFSVEDLAFLIRQR